MSAPLPLDEAQRRLLAMAAPLGREDLPAERCIGRYLAADLTALRTQPAADMSAMDGFAVAGPGPWQSMGESAAGRPFPGRVEPGQAVRISTGALLPPGADAVLIQEEARREGQTVRVAPGGAATARHIRRRGFDFAAGDVVLPVGTRIGAAGLALALTAGHGGTLPVGRLPRVAVLDSGDELALGASAWDDHRLPASNGAMVAALVAPLAASVARIGPVPDRLDALADALEAADGADVLVTSGGASVGDHDLIRPALQAWGADIDFWRVAIRPGKPLLVARRGATLVLGLPGNPVSSYVTAVLFLMPLLRRLAGAGECLPCALTVPLAAPLPPGGERTEFIRARLVGGAAQPLTERDSSALRSLAGADALVRREIAAPVAHAGELVTVYLLGSP